MNKLCPVPWLSQSIRANGDIRVCCQAQHGPTGGIIKNENGEVLNASTSNFSNIKNASLYKEIRKYMIEDKWHPECVRCETEEKNGMHSRRLNENTIWIDEGAYTWEYLLKNTEQDGTIDTQKIKTEHYDLRFGNLCNLKCRMCGPTDSSQWYNDHAELWGDVFKDSHGEVKLIKNNKGNFEPEINMYNWHENPSFWNFMEGNIPNIKHLYLVGGEPFMILEHYEFLQKCVDLGYAKNIIVEYNSNITNIPQKAWNIWKYFKRIQIGASIDGYGIINDYIRYPSKFHKIKENLYKLNNAEGDFNLWIASTINVYNIFYLPEFCKWIIGNQMENVNKGTKQPLMVPHPLHGPKFLSVKIFPKHIKEKIKNKLNNSIPELEKFIEKQKISKKRKEILKRHLKEIYEQYITFMFSDDYSNLLEKFWMHTRKLDGIRKTYIELYCPELYDLIKETEPKHERNTN